MLLQAARFERPRTVLALSTSRQNLAANFHEQHDPGNHLRSSLSASLLAAAAAGAQAATSGVGPPGIAGSGSTSQGGANEAGPSLFSMHSLGHPLLGPAPGDNVAPIPETTLIMPPVNDVGSTVVIGPGAAQCQHQQLPQQQQQQMETAPAVAVGLHDSTPQQHSAHIGGGAGVVSPSATPGGAGGGLMQQIVPQFFMGGRRTSAEDFLSLLQVCNRLLSLEMIVEKDGFRPKCYA